MAAFELRHGEAGANGVRLHYARAGSGPPLLLLHGWPEFWLAWEPVMARLADRFDLIAPDLRGFGDSEKPDAGRPSDRAGAEVHAADVLGLADALGLGRFGLVGHDVGAYVMQAAARRAPERLTGLFFFDCPHPGIGARWAAPEHLREIWYQSFHQQPWAAELVGSSREACRIYLGHFLRHWSAGNPRAFDGVLEAWVDNFMKPGNLQGGFDWYLSANAARLAAIRGEAPAQPPIAVPACVRWGALDPILKVAWADRLDETFADLDFAPLEGVGHFPHREDPDRAAAEIAGFFGRLGAG
jgi:pimeloyl-ACP methyl ester carboxylesterase